MARLPMPFGNPTTYPGHSGIDFPGHAGEAIPASGPGRVVSRGRNDRGGFFIWIQYDGVSYPVGYHHMNSHDGCPAVGTRVVLGQRLGYAGWTGNVKPAGRAGAHLHSEVSGNATTDGYWKFFDRNRVVGQGAAAGGGTSKEDDVSASEVWAFPVKRDGGKVEAIQELADTKTISIRTEGAVKGIASTLRPVTRGGREVEMRQDLVDTGTVARDTLAAVQALAKTINAGGVTEAQVKQIADAVIAAVGRPTVSIDYAAIAKAVNDDAARRMFG